MTTVAKAFVDTNIILRAHHREMDNHQAALALLDRMWDNNVELWISRQIIREYLVQVSNNRNKVMLNSKAMIAQMDMLQSTFHVADETLAVTAKLRELIDRFPTGGKQVHDANIVATMIIYNINTLLTSNLSDLERFDTLVTLVSPDDVTSE
jgi:predicted nucleic acid-binding protein